MTGDIFSDLMLLVWLLGFVHLWNEAQPVPQLDRVPVRLFEIDGRKVPYYQ